MCFNFKQFNNVSKGGKESLGSKKNTIWYLSKLEIKCEKHNLT